MLFREQLTEVLTSRCCGLIEGLRDKTAPPIVTSKLSQSSDAVQNTGCVLAEVLCGRCVSKRGRMPGEVVCCDQVFAIGEYFVRHLFETRHRGAFELTYVGFTSVCETFWK